MEFFISFAVSSAEVQENNWAAFFVTDAGAWCGQCLF